jgi:hypothetical protein
MARLAEAPDQRGGMAARAGAPIASAASTHASPVVRPGATAKAMVRAARQAHDGQRMSVPVSAAA